MTHVYGFAVVSHTRYPPCSAMVGAQDARVSDESVVCREMFSNLLAVDVRSRRVQSFFYTNHLKLYVYL